MNNLLLRTRYASPLRSKPATIKRQRSLLVKDENLRSLLDAMPDLVMIINGNRQVVLGNKTLTDFAKSLGLHSYIGMRPGEIGE